MPRKKIVNINQINGNNLIEKDHAFYIQHLEKGIRMIDSMSRRHSKVLQERVDLRYPKTIKSDGSNADFSTTLQNYTKDLTRKKVDVQYFARREQRNQSDNPHLHVAILVDCNKRRCRQSLLEQMEKHWADTLKMPVEEIHAKKLVYPCNHNQDGNPRPNGYMLERKAIEFNDTRRVDHINMWNRLPTGCGLRCLNQSNFITAAKLTATTHTEIIHCQLLSGKHFCTAFCKDTHSSSCSSRLDRTSLTG